MRISRNLSILCAMLWCQPLASPAARSHRHRRPPTPTPTPPGQAVWRLSGQLGVSMSAELVG